MMILNKKLPKFIRKYYSKFSIKRYSEKQEIASKKIDIKENLEQKKSVPFQGSFPLVNKTTTLLLKRQNNTTNAALTKSSRQIYDVF
jgi:hypothetical protein